MIQVYSDATYSNGKEVNEVIQSLQEKYGFLNKFEEYIIDNMNRFNLEYKGNFPYGKFDQFLKVLFREYIIHKAHNINYKKNGLLEFVDTGLLITTTNVKYLTKIK